MFICMIVKLKKIKCVVKNFEKVKKQVSDVVKIGTRLTTTNAELHSKNGLLQLLNWVLDVFRRFFCHHVHAPTCD